MRIAWWLSAVLVAAFVLAGCETGDGVAQQVSGTTAPHTCTKADGVSIVPDYTDHATGTTVFAWKVRSRHRCQLSWYPRVRLYDAKHHVLPFSAREQSPGKTQGLVIDPKHDAALSLRKYRCDVGPATDSKSARVVLSTGFAATVGVELPYCTDTRDGNDLTIEIRRQAATIEPAERSVRVMPTSHAKVAGHDEVAGACGASQGPIAVVDVGPDTPNPRCQVVAKDQELEVRNKTSEFGQHGREVTIRWRNYPLVTLRPGQQVVFSGPFGGYLLPGSHDVGISIFAGGGAELVIR